MIQISDKSHVDHGIPGSLVQWVLEEFHDKTSFFISTAVIPQEFASIQCELHGPFTGDLPIPETEVWYAVRGKRKGATRVCGRPKRPTRLITLIAGASPDRPSVMVVYTMFGGPPGAKEVWDPTISSMEELNAARAFWATHALSRASG